MRDQAILYHYILDLVGPGRSAVVARHRKILSADEKRRIDSLHFADLRDYRLVARAMVRNVLSLRAAVDPQDWTFRRNAYGRPEIDTPREFRDLRFSISHALPVAVCLTGWGRELGVDIEPLRPVDGLLDIAARNFAPSETSALRALPQDRRHKRFIELWTLKEAYVKAIGTGLYTPLNELWFNVSDAPLAEIAVHFDPRRGEDPNRWQFGFQAFSKNHVLATVIERNNLDRTEVAIHNAALLIDAARY